MATPTQWLTEFQVNTGAADKPKVENTQIIGLANGNFLVVWEEPGTNGAGTFDGVDIIGKIFDAEGNVVENSFPLNTISTQDDEYDFSIAATNDGGFVMVYVDDDSPTSDVSDVIWERYDATGALTHAVPIAKSNDPDGQLLNPQVVVNQDDNSSFVTWTDPSDGIDIFGVRLSDVGGASSGFTVDDNAGSAYINSSTLNTSGNLVKIYGSLDAGPDLNLAEFDHGGNLIREIVAVDGAAQIFADPVVAGLTNGDIALAYQNGGNLFFNIFSADGSTFSSILPNDTNVSPTILFSEDETDPRIVALPDGDFVIVWDNETTGAFEGRRFNPDGTTDGDEFIINVGAGADLLGDVGATADGRLLFSWEVDGEIFASIFDPRDGTTINATDYNNLEENFLSGSNVITAQIAGSTINGTDADETFLGQGGNDIISVGRGNDIVRAGSGRDVVIVDFTDPAGAIDFYNGGDGVDLISYTADLQSNDTLDMLTDEFRVDGILHDRFVNFENLTFNGQANVIGTHGDNFINNIGDDVFADANIRGMGGNDTINAGQGADILNGGLGGDALDGGEGLDTATYENATESVIVDIVNVHLNTGEAAGDTYTSIENLTGSSFRDTLRGDNEVNVLHGGGEVDILLGRGGNDTLFGDDGNDAMFGSNGSDLMYGQTGNDAFVGGNGRDTMFGGTGSDTFRIDSILHSTVGANADNIMDFSSADNDRIDVSRIDADTTTGGNQAFTFIGAAAFSGTAGELRFDGDEVFGDINGDGVADFEINVTGITDADDFVL